MRNYEQGMLIILSPIVGVLLFVMYIIFSKILAELSKEIIKYIGEAGNFIFWYIVFCVLLITVVYSNIAVSTYKKYY